MKKLKIAFVFAAVVSIMAVSCKPKEKCPAYGHHAYKTEKKKS